MEEQKINWKRFIITSIVAICVAYLATVIVFGVIWDPNGAILLERPWQDALRIIGIGFYMCIPMGFSSFLVNHPVPVTMGLGYFALAIIGVIGRKNQTGRLILYTLMVLITVLGTVQFFLMA